MKRRTTKTRKRSEDIPPTRQKFRAVSITTLLNTVSEGNPVLKCSPRRVKSSELFRLTPYKKSEKLKSFMYRYLCKKLENWEIETPLDMVLQTAGSPRVTRRIMTSVVSKFEGPK